MSKASTLAKLQSLLERVRARSSMPRNGQTGPALAAVAAPEPPPMLEVSGAATVPPPSAPVDDVVVEEIAVEIDVSEPEIVAAEAYAPAETPADVPAEAPADADMPPPLAPPQEAPAPAAASGVSLSERAGPLPFESLPPPEAADAGPLPFESLPPPPAAAATPPSPEGPSPAASESAERLVAAERLTSEPPVEIVAGPPTPPPEAPPVEMHAAPEARSIAVDTELPVPPSAIDAPPIPAAPASSRRPVAPEPEERLAEMAFGSEEPAQPPRHTPPPESGRLPASPVEEFDADVTGVRSAPHSDTSARTPEISPVEARAPLSSSVATAEIVGAPPPFQPATFAAWLDATLGL